MDEIVELGKVLSDEERVALVDALRAISNKIRWKPGKDIVHLKKRCRMKHMSGTLADYEQIIYNILRNEKNVVYLYDFMGTHYYVVRGFTTRNEWLVIFGRDGLMETAFPPQNIDEYLEHRGFVFLGRIEEILQWIEKANT